ncbi:hypothetical protein CF319_g6418 [Tilletia indica]|nr:hypothetical protein CF319_g6418 [Tilletia indica]
MIFDIYTALFLILSYYSLLWLQYKNPHTAMAVFILPVFALFELIQHYFIALLSTLPHVSFTRPETRRFPRGLPRQPFRQFVKLAFPALVVVQILNMSQPLPQPQEPTSFLTLPPSVVVPSVVTPQTISTLSTSNITDLAIYDRPMELAVYSPRIVFYFPSTFPVCDPKDRPTALSAIPSLSISRPRLLSTLMAIQVLDNIFSSDFRTTRNQRWAVGLGVGALTISLFLL